ncbi:MAG: hypothetical protein ACRDGJ_04995 [Candidatus Limnocylindria bacterium]
MVLLIGLALLRASLDDERQTSTYSYSELLNDAAAGKVEAIIQEGISLTVLLGGASESRTVAIASESINVYAEVCAAAGAQLGECPISYEARAPSAAGQWVGLLVTALLPVLLIGAFILFMMRQAQRQKPGR